MKRVKNLRSLEDLWELEDRYPLVDSNPSGLLRWMLATGMSASPLPGHRSTAPRISKGRRHSKNGRS